MRDERVFTLDRQCFPTEAPAPETKGRGRSRGSGRSTSASLGRLSIGAALATVVACSEPSTAPVAPQMESAVLLDAQAVSAVRTVLDDANGRLIDAIEDAAVRSQLSRALIALQQHLDAGQLRQAEAATAEARGVLSRAAQKDTGPSMSADLEAIDLALGVVAEQIVKTRQQSAGGEQ